MKNKQSLRLPLALVIAALLGLAASVIFNFLSKGKADQAFLFDIAKLASMGLNCTHPSQSPLFDTSSAVYGSKELNIVLYGPDGKLIAKNWPLHLESSFPQSIEQLENRYQKSLTFASFLNEGAWVKLSNVCDRGWQLYVNDPNNKMFRHHILSRQKTLFLSVCASFFSLFLSLWFYLKAKNREATSVLREFSEGQLDVRVSIRPWERSFDLLHEFNRMATQVASLFNKVKGLEESRSQLISELAHDTRTPIASLLSGLDTLSEFGSSMKPDQKDRVLENMRADLHYFSKLVEDLFLLSEIDSRAHLNWQESINMIDLITRCWGLIFPGDLESLNCKLKVEEPANASVPFKGDLVLLQRMLVNLLENAKRHAISWVLMEARINGSTWELTISNDSKKLSQSELAEWGHKRKKRIIHDNGPKLHTSLGLGSSIAKRIAESHSGTLAIEQKDEQQGVDVAIIKVSLSLPLSS